MSPKKSLRSDLTGSLSLLAILLRVAIRPGDKTGVSDLSFIKCVNVRSTAAIAELF
jgi:hypothetical protein